MLRILNITAPDINNGNGIRVTLWVAGCANRCQGCHNQWTWDYDQGIKFREHKEEIYAKLSDWLDRDYVEGMTFSGGDPMTQYSEALEDELEIIRWFREHYPAKNIWLYTGLTFEKLLHLTKLHKEIVDNIDTLVEGPYKEELRDVAHTPFRGSTNQKIIYLKK